jgi:hypothetical protein
MQRSRQEVIRLVVVLVGGIARLESDVSPSNGRQSSVCVTIASGGQNSTLGISISDCVERRRHLLQSGLITSNTSTSTWP